jgi:hypothetical protein
MIKRFCDRCGKEIVGELWYSNVRLESSKSTDTIHFMLNSGWSVVGPIMCAGCFEGVERRVKHILEGPCRACC